jgi:hypothetical protein
MFPETLRETLDFRPFKTGRLKRCRPFRSLKFRRSNVRPQIGARLKRAHIGTGMSVSVCSAAFSALDFVGEPPSATS